MSHEETILIVYVGTFTRFGSSQGIYVLSLGETSEDGSVIQAVTAPDPSYLALSRERSMLYSASHVTNVGGRPGSLIVGWEIDTASGRLRRATEQVAPHAHAAYLAIDRQPAVLLVACPLGGGISVLPLDETGRVGPAACSIDHDGTPVVPRGHIPPAGDYPPLLPGVCLPHAILPSPNDALVVVPDVGLNGLALYRLDAPGAILRPAKPAFVPARPGAGPRHGVFHPRLGVLYVVNERDSSISVYRHALVGGNVEMEEIQAVSARPGGMGRQNLASDIVLHPSCGFVYSANRGHDSIAVFGVDASSGRLELIQIVGSGGRNPRAIAVTPRGDRLFVANTDSDTITRFQIERASGRLTAVGRSLSVPAPSCIRFLALGPVEPPPARERCGSS